MCKDMFINNYMPANKIVGNASNKPISQVCREWLLHMNNPDFIPEVPRKVKNINQSTYDELVKPHVAKGKKRQYTKSEHTFTVDAYNKKLKLVKEFNGCYFHGCPKCNPERKDKYIQTLERKIILEQSGHKVEEIWECDWLALKKTLPNRTELETEAKAQNINLRDALFGGRTEGFKSYHKCTGKQRILYFDVTSLYPTVNALDDYCVGFKNM